MLEILKHILSGFWIFIGSLIVLYTIANAIAIILQRLFRMIMILFKGWPPNHLDADGDFKK